MPLQHKSVELSLKLKGDPAPLLRLASPSRFAAGVSDASGVFDASGTMKVKA